MNSVPAQKTPVKPPPPPAQIAVPIGPRVVEVLDIAYRARRSVLLEGSTGIGKSQIVSEFAKARGLGFVVLDLSLLEPPDLIGLPVMEGGRTHYACPAELPRDGCGVLMLEELNRAEIPVMQPALQLLSARRLHAYELPEGWTCVAAINPEDGDYQVNRLDPALRARFLQLSVYADRDTWLGWAARTNVHPVITRLATDHPDIFDQAPPRSWTYASDLLHVLAPEERSNTEFLRVAMRGYLPTSWASLVVEALAKYPALPDIDMDALLGNGGQAVLSKMVADLNNSKRTDAIAMIAAALRRQFVAPAFCARVETGAVTVESLEKLLALLPGDMRDQCLEGAMESPSGPFFLRQLGYDPATIAASYSSSPLRAQTLDWKREMKLHRVRLVISVMMRWLDETRGERVVQDGAASQLMTLAVDSAPLGQDLSRWLRARGLVPERKAG
jgi:AAA domain (dynein-related subfamily)